MPARLSLTKAQRDALLTLPDTEEAFVRHYSFTGEDGEILWRYRTPETRLAFALQLCILRYPGRVLRQGEVMPLHLLAFIAEQVGVPPADQRLRASAANSLRASGGSAIPVRVLRSDGCN